jgi:hypothetical protein
VNHASTGLVAIVGHVVPGIFFGAAMTAALEARGPATPALAFARAWLTVAVGNWFLVAAWVIGATHYDLDSTAVVLRVRLFFIWDVGITGLVLALLASWPKAPGDRRRSSGGTRAAARPPEPLTSDEERLESVGRR